MPRIKRLSGSDVIKFLQKFGFEIHSQKGSHVKMRRVTQKGKETLTIPNHRQLDTGTCHATLQFLVWLILYPYNSAFITYDARENKA